MASTNSPAAAQGSRASSAPRQSVWYRLDNAAKIYPPLASRRITTLFRLSVHLTEPIQISVLQRALDHMMERFPFFNVDLRPGFFWYFFDVNHNRPVVEGDSRDPCMDYSIRKPGYFPFRLRAWHNRIALEFSHAITDGTGALLFLKSLVTEYLRLQGRPVPAQAHYPLYGQTPKPGENDDSFRQYYNPRIPPPDKAPKAFRLPATLLPRGRYRIITGLMPVKEIRRTAGQHQTKITEYLLAVYLASLQDVLESLPPDIRRRRNKPIRVSVPVNLRSIYPSESLRNFFLHVEPFIDPRLGRYSLDEIIAKVHHYLRFEIDPKFIRQQISRNIKGEQNLTVRLFPLFLKSPIIRTIYRKMGENRLTSGFSNLGQITLPPEIAPFVTGFRFIPPPSPITGVKCSLVSYQDTMAVSFGSERREKDLERFFFTRLRQAGIPVKIETNE